MTLLEFAHSSSQNAGWASASVRGLYVGLLLGGTLALGIVLRLRYRLSEASARAREAERTRDVYLKDLRNRTDFERELLDHIPSPVYVRDESGHFVHANRAVCELIGVPWDELIGRTVRDIAPPEVAQRYEDSDAAVLSGKLRHEETVVFDAAGNRLDVVAQKTVVRPHPRGPRWIVGSFIDISAAKAHSRELTEALERAEQGSRAKSEFLATISHEMRTPLHGILGLAECLQSEDLDPTSDEWVQMIIGAGERMLSTVEDMLLLAGLDREDHRQDISPMTLKHVLRPVRERTEVAAHAKRLDFSWDEDMSDTLVVRGHAASIELVLGKLIDNAIKFTIKGSVGVRVEVEEADEGRAVLHFEIRDTGVGISADRADAIFEAFVQSDSSPTRRFEGAGLGLTVAHRLVTLMGGTMDFRSKAGKGTTFVVSIPMEIESSETITAGQPV